MDKGTSVLSPDTPQPSPTPMGFGPQTKLGYEDYLLGNEKKYSNFHFRIETEIKARLWSLISSVVILPVSHRHITHVVTEEHRAHKTLA